MCTKINDTELASVKSLMAIVLNMIIADVFRVKLREIRPELRLVEELGMTSAQKAQLEEMVAEYFDGLRLDCGPGTSLADVHAQVVDDRLDGQLVNPSA